MSAALETLRVADEMTLLVPAMLARAAAVGVLVPLAALRPFIVASPVEQALVVTPAIAIVALATLEELAVGILVGLIARLADDLEYRIDGDLASIDWVTLPLAGNLLNFISREF